MEQGPESTTKDWLKRPTSSVFLSFCSLFLLFFLLLFPSFHLFIISSEVWRRQLRLITRCWPKQRKSNFCFLVFVLSVFFSFFLCYINTILLLRVVAGFQSISDKQPGGFFYTSALNGNFIRWKMTRKLNRVNDCHECNWKDLLQFISDDFLSTFSPMHTKVYFTWNVRSFLIVCVCLYKGVYVLNVLHF